IWRDDFWRGNGHLSPLRPLGMHQKAYDVYQKLARANPGVLHYEERLANAQVSRGVYLTDARRFEEGVKLIRQGLDFSQKMSAQFPSKVRYRLLVALAHRRLFELYDRNR